MMYVAKLWYLARIKHERSCSHHDRPFIIFEDRKFHFKNDISDIKFRKIDENKSFFRIVTVTSQN